jgi:uncharacterized protein YbjT (DUF2867 family)
MSANGSGTGKLAVVFGGSGFVGRHTVAALARRGYRVRAAVRRPDLAGHLQPMGAVGQIHAVQANLRYPESVVRAVADADVVINLVAVLASTGRQTFDALHVNGAKTIANAARAANASRLIHISAIGADEAAGSRYARTKGEGERAVLAEFPNAVIVRPSLVFGPEDDLFNRFAAMARVSPFLPLIGRGWTKFQPVYVGDLATAIANAADGLAVPGKTYEVGGPEVVTFRDILDKTMLYSGRKRLYFPLPFWLAKLQALATWPLPNALRPVTYDQVRSLQSDNVVSDAALREGRTLSNLGVANPVGIPTIVPQYLERFRPRGQYAHYRNA